MQLNPPEEFSKTAPSAPKKGIKTRGASGGGGDRPKGGVTFWEKSQFLAGKNWKNPKFWRRRRQNFGNFFDFLRKIMIFGHKMSEIALKTLKMQ